MQNTWAIEERAAQLAILHLTRRDDLTVTRAALDAKVDFLVNLGKEGKQTGRVFAVELKAGLFPQGAGTPKAGSSELLLPSAWESKLARVSEGYTDLPFPLCLFFFSMPSDLGYYAWLRRPSNEPGTGGPALRTEKPTALKPLTDIALDEIVASVNKWYDKLRVSSPLPEARSLAVRPSKNLPLSRPRRRIKTA
jgi:hypothetical protein